MNENKIFRQNTWTETGTHTSCNNMKTYRWIKYPQFKALYYEVNRISASSISP